jgi:hypothetical protein
MQGDKEMFLRMREDDFNILTPGQREIFTYVEVREANEYENNKSDSNYITLHKAKRKATKDVQEYLFNKRHK